MGKRDAKPAPHVEVRESTKVTRREYRDFSGPRGASALLRVALDRIAFADLTAHAKESLEAEVCGVLVGQVCEDDEGPWLHVQAVIRGAAARQGSTHVTFTQETWNVVHESLERDHPGRHIVGWYHTHPGFGVEFSEMDLFIQRNFFPGAEQIAFVTDPLGGAVAICVNRPSGIEYLERFWVDGREQPCRRPEAVAVATAGDSGLKRPGSGDGAAIRALEERVAQLIQAHDDTRALFYRTMAMLGVVGCVGIIAAVCYLIFQSYTSRLEPPRTIGFAPIPVQVGDKTVLLGVNLVEWQVPPELEARFIKLTREQAQQEIEAYLKAMQENATRPAIGTPSDKGTLPPAKSDQPQP